MTTKEYMEAKIQQLIAKCDRLTRERDEARRERDEARIEVCTLSGNGSCDSTEREAESRGWKYLFVSEDSDA